MYCHFLFAILRPHCTRLPREETLPTSFSFKVGVEDRGKEGVKGDMLKKTKQNKKILAEKQKD